MKMIFLGTAGYFPTASRHTQAVLLPDAGLMFDAGTGVSRLVGQSVPKKLDIFLSHAHLDHICGLTYLLGLAPHCGIEQITVHGEPEKLAAIREHLFSEFLFPVDPPFQWRSIQAGERIARPDGATLQTFRLEHPGGVLGYRIDWPDRSIAYVTDTTADENAAYVDEIRGVDVLVHECNFDTADTDWARTTGHSWTAAVGRVAARAGVGRLVLLHVSPFAPDDAPLCLDEVRAEFAHTTVADDLFVVEF